MAAPLFAANGYRAAAFRAIVARLESAPETRIVRSWKSWSGQSGRPGEAALTDDQPPALGNLPWVRLTPLTLPMALLANTPRSQKLAYKAPFKIQVETAVAGPRVDDAINLWEAIERVLWPDDDAGRAAWNAQLDGLGVRHLVPRQPALPTSLGNLSLEMIVADGEIEVEMFVNL